MSPLSAHPYDALTPTCILDALDAVGLRGDGRLTALSSYENRVYQVMLEDGSAVVAKFYRPGRWSRAQIQEEHDFAADLMRAEVPMIGPLQLQGQTLHHFAGFDFSVSPRRGGRRPDLDNDEVLERVGRFLARLHSVGVQGRFAVRPVLDPETLGQASLDWLLAHRAVALEVQTAWTAACTEALAAARAAFARVAAQLCTLRLHGDCHPGNILWTPDGQDGAGPHFVDLDDARTGPAVQDLWMLQSGDRALRQRQLGALLDGYESWRDFDRRELVLIEPLRTLRLIHYSAWLAQRWSDPAFAPTFPGFGSRDYWQGQVLLLHEQLEAMASPVLHV
jgi:Ser/Thr protein kinase RdoA (MazF antagonist)